MGGSVRIPGEGQSCRGPYGPRGVFGGWWVRRDVDGEVSGHSVQRELFRAS